MVLVEYDTKHYATVPGTYRIYKPSTLPTFMKLSA